MILLKQSRDLQVSFAAVTRLVEELLSFSFSFLGWDETESTWYVGHLLPLLYQLRMIDD
jgi:hypothetical protein